MIGQDHQGDILIVDDKPENLDLLSTMLVNHHYHVRAALNGTLALRAVRAVLPDLILLDINMPGMNGYEVCQHLKSQAETKDIPVLFISAFDGTIDKIRAFNVGGVDYITKPFQIEEVLARIHTQLTLYRQRQELQQRYQQIREMQHAVRHYLSGRAWEEIQSSVNQHEHMPAKRERLTIVMSDIAGFTQLSEQVDPHLLLADLSVYMNILTTQVYQHQGEVDKFLGDGMLAFFTDPSQAFQAACLMQQQIAVFNINQIQQKRFPFPTRIGIATGSVILGQLGSAERKEYTIMGDRVNVAHRLQSQASTGSILMDEPTWQQLQRPDHAIPAAVVMKGKQDAEMAYALSFEAISTALHNGIFPGAAWSSSHT
ncbi:MAG: adenylate/guanylate cyclase domain-containing response regulator [Chloroflexaceae bacterium]|nr:adenylate/guanylate cyclase domain-containing response regulator [Chloroflexaceae bacterium]